MIENITYDDRILAIIIRAGFEKDGIEFFTPSDFSQQLAYMKRPKNHVIEPHVHNILHREVQYTLEVLFIKSGRIRVDFYDNNRNYLESRYMKTGDVILLADGGHGFEMLEESEIIEVKQGPYAGDQDKVRFEPFEGTKINVKES